MAKVYLAFLGTNNYLPCTYYYREREVANIRFVQEATVQFFCDGWGPQDRILIFLTEEAQRRNWLDGGQKNLDDAPQTPCQGLQTRLSQLSLAPRVEAIQIPDGKTEDEIWTIFQTMFSKLASRDEIVFDITHAFRSIPMLAMVVLNYAKVMQDIGLLGIYYGAFEVMGSMAEARQTSLDQRRVPIFNLSQFDALLDWTVAIDRFLGAGDAMPACALVRKHIAPVKRATQGRDLATAMIGQLANRLEAFSKVISTCRGRKITPVINQLKDDIRRCAELPLPPPFQPLLERLERKIGSFQGNPDLDGIRAARWCLDHNLIQQGFTLLQEFGLTFLMQQAGVDGQDLRHRNITSQAVTVYLKKIPEADWRPPAANHRDLARQVLLVIGAHKELAKVLEQVKTFRDDINHGGFLSSSKEPKDFAPGLHGLITRVERLIT